MSAETLEGSCLCGEVAYVVTTQVRHFFQCHCVQCRKTTASAFAANLIGDPAEINWKSGEDNLRRFDHPTRGFTQVFCGKCGSGLPFVDPTGEMLFVPAGTLDNEPLTSPEANIFWSEKACWYEDGVKAPRQATFDDA